MANSDTKEKILVLRVDVTKAVDEINRYNTMLEESREEEKKLREQEKQNSDNKDEYRKKIIAVKAAQTEYKSAVRDLSKAIQEEIKLQKQQDSASKITMATIKETVNANRRSRDSIAELNAENRKLREVVRSLDFNTQKNEIDELNTVIEANTALIKLNTDAQTKQKMSVGDYQKALSGLDSIMVSLKGRMDQLEKTGRGQSDEYKQLASAYDQAKAECDQFTQTLGSLQGKSVSVKQRLRELREEMMQLEVQGKGNTEQYQALLEESVELIGAQRAVNDQINNLEPPTAKLDALMSGLTGIAGGFSAWQGAMAAVGVESEDFEAVQTKLQAAIALTNGLTAVTNMLDKDQAFMVGLKTAAQSKNIIVSKAAIVVQKALNAVVSANPIGLFVTVVLAAAGALTVFAFRSKETKERQKELGQEIEKTNSVLEQLKSDSDFDVAIAEASGKSQAEFINIRKEAAKTAVALADINLSKVIDAYGKGNATKEQLKEAQRMQEDALDQLNAINREATINDVKQRTEGAKKAVEIRKEQQQKELEAVRAAQDAIFALITSETERQLTQTEATYNRQIEDLKKRLETEKDLTVAARKAINSQINALEDKKEIDLAQIRQQANKDEIQKEADKQAKLIELRLSALKEGSDEELALRIQQLELQKAEEIRAAEELGIARVEVEAKYNKLIEDERAKTAENLRNKAAEELALEWQNKINEAALHHEDTLQLEVEYRRSELEALHQMEGESDAEFKARQLEAEQNYVDAKKTLANKEMEIEQAKYEAAAAITGGMSDMLAEIGENNRAFAAASKILALAEIAIDTGKAISAGVASAMEVPFPANLVAVATTITTVMANITNAIKTVKSAKFAEGGLVTGPGSGTSDSIPAHLSNGESVMTSRATEMFAPVLSAFNQIGGGVPISVQQSSSVIEGEEMLARAVAKGVAALPRPVVSVEEITTTANRVAVLEKLGDA